MDYRYIKNLGKKRNKAPEPQKVRLDGVDYVKIKGEPGHTPTDKQLIELIKPLIPDVKDGHTPTRQEILSIVMGELRDYVEARIPDVKDGKTPTKKELEGIVRPLIDKAVASLDLRPGEKGEPGKDGSPDTPLQIADKLNTLDKMVDFKVLKNIPQGLGLHGKKMVTGVSQGVAVQDGGVSVLSVAKTINFGDNLDVTVNGSAVTVTGGGGGSSNFLDLTDTPSAYTGDGEKFVKVKATEDGLEFVAGSGASVAWGDITGTQSDINLSGFTNDSSFITGVDWDEIGGTQSDINLSGFTNDSSFITGVAWGDITGTQSSINLSGFNNDSGFITGVAWNEITGTQSSINLSGFTNDSGFITATLTNEEVQDIVGLMLTGNTETLITVTYQDDDGTIDFVVDNDLSHYSNATSGFITVSSLDNLADTAIQFGNGNSTASTATALGKGNTASAGYAVAVGYDNDATGAASASFGSANQASGLVSTAIGYASRAQGDYAGAFGYDNDARQQNSIAIGNENDSDGEQSTAIGYKASVSADDSVAIGNNISNSTASSVEIGPSNTEKLRISSSGVNFVTAGAGTFAVNGSPIGGNVSKVGTPANDQIAVWTGDGTIEGSSSFVFDGTNFVNYAGGISSYGANNIYISTANTFSTGLSISKRGTTGDATASITSGTEIGYHSFYGWDGDSYERGSFVFVKATEDWDASGNGTSYEIWTCPNGSTTETVALKLDQDQSAIFYGNITASSATLVTLGNFVFDTDQTVGAGQDNYVLTYDNSSGQISLEASAGGGASQLSDLSDVNTSTATNRNVLVADGTDWESRALVEADISDLGSYITASSTDTLTNKSFSGQVEGDVFHFGSETDNGNSGASKTIDWSSKLKHEITLTADCTLTFTAPSGACNMSLKVTQDGTGGWEFTFPGTVLWPSGVEIQPSSGASEVSIFSFYFDGTNYYGQAAVNFS